MVPDRSGESFVPGGILLTSDTVGTVATVGKVGKTAMARLPEIEQAERQILEKAAERESWSPKELRQNARETMDPQVISLAFWRLLKQGELELDPDLQVHLPVAAR